MPAAIRWYLPGSILLITCSGQTTADEFNAALKIMLRDLDEATHTVHIIADWREAVGEPFFVDVLQMSVNVLEHKNIGTTVIIGYRAVFGYWLDILNKIVPTRIRTEPNIEAAVVFLKHLDEASSESS